MSAMIWAAYERVSTEEQAQVVRDIFHWVVHERLSGRQTCIRLTLLPFLRLAIAFLALVELAGRRYGRGLPPP